MKKHKIDIPVVIAYIFALISFILGLFFSAKLMYFTALGGFILTIVSSYVVIKHIKNKEKK